jgi:hypothetical protein
VKVSTLTPENSMKYLCLIYSDEKKMGSLSPTETGALMGEYNAFTASIQNSGHYVAAERLRPTQTATTIRSRNGKISTTDGPFAETKEFLAGYWIVDVDTPERAYAIAAEASAAPGPGGKPINMPIEVREVMSGPPEV